MKHRLYFFGKFTLLNSIKSTFAIRHQTIFLEKINIVGRAETGVFTRGSVSSIGIHVATNVEQLI